MCFVLNSYVIRWISLNGYYLYLTGESLKKDSGISDSDFHDSLVNPDLDYKNVVIRC